MAKKKKLDKRMSLAAFDHGYWYAVELRAFAKELGIPRISLLRKDEMEQAIRSYLTKGEVVDPTKRKRSGGGTKDSDRGLSANLQVSVYTNNSETKDFLEALALKIDSGYRMKSGAKLRLNRWREAKMMANKKITYGDLAKEYVRLSAMEDPFEQLPSGRYINFLSDFHRGEIGATQADALAAWHQLKKLNVAKNYRSWAKWRDRQKK